MGEHGDDERPCTYQTANLMGVSYFQQRLAFGNNKQSHSIISQLIEDEKKGSLYFLFVPEYTSLVAISRNAASSIRNVEDNGQFLLGSQVAKELDQISPDTVKNASPDGIERSNRCKKEHFCARHQLEINTKFHNVYKRLLNDSSHQKVIRKRGGV